MNILISGASGFIGSGLVRQLSLNPSYNVRCITRNPDSLRGRVPPNIQIVKADGANLSDLVSAMTGIDVAYYLIHSMEGSSRDWKKFEERDREIARNFAVASTRCNVKRIIYLGGLTNEKNPDRLSPHMKSRYEVGEILKQSTASVTIFRAAVILGYGGGSSEMLSYLVDRLPLMVCPKWVLTRSQPIAVDDVVSYLAKTIEAEETVGRTFDIGGPEVLTYTEMMKRYARLTGKSVRIMIIPFLTPRLSSYWVDLITPLRASLARPLIDSLKHEAIVEDDSIKKLIPMKLKSIDEAVRQSKSEAQQAQLSKVGNSARSISASLIIILFALVAAAFINTVKLQTLGVSISMLPVEVIMYLTIAVSLFFLLRGTRLGSLIAGIFFWLTVGLVGFELYLVPSSTYHPDIFLISNVVVLSVGIAASHVRFHLET